MNPDITVLLLIVIASGYPIYRIRKDFLIFTFLSLFHFLYIVVPFYSIFIQHQNSLLAYLSIELSLVFLFCFYITYRSLLFGRTINTVDIFFHSGPKLQLMYKYAYLPLVAGIVLKLIGGDIIHVSIAVIPWKFPVLFGIADRIYYLGVMIASLNLYREGFNRRTIFVIGVIFSLAVLGGSRGYLLLPLSFIILLSCSNGNFLHFMKVGLLGIGSLFSIVFLVGTYRIDAADRSFDFDVIHDLILYRLSEFYWPMALIEKIEAGLVLHNINWIFTGLLGSVPAIVSDFFLGLSVFGRDTRLMRDVDLGKLYASVPLTPIGEGYYWAGIYGVILISIMFALGFAYLNIIGRLLKKFTLLILFLQLYRSVFALPSAAFPEFISLITKDLLIDYTIVLIYWKTILLFHQKNLRKSHL